MGQIVATEEEAVAKKSRAVCRSLCLEKLSKFVLDFLLQEEKGFNGESPNPSG